MPLPNMISPIMISQTEDRRTKDCLPCCEIHPVAWPLVPVWAECTVWRDQLVWWRTCQISRREVPGSEGSGAGSSSDGGSGTSAAPGALCHHLVRVSDHHLSRKVRFRHIRNIIHNLDALMILCESVWKSFDPRRGKCAAGRWWPQP